jgi:hypothetical protein
MVIGCYLGVTLPSLSAKRSACHICKAIVKRTGLWDIGSSSSAAACGTLAACCLQGTVNDSPETVLHLQDSYLTVNNC